MKFAAENERDCERMEGGWSRESCGGKRGDSNVEVWGVRGALICSSGMLEPEEEEKGLLSPLSPVCAGH